MYRSVTAADDKAVTFLLHRAEVPDAPGGVAAAIDVTRIVERLDLAEASRINAYFHTEDPHDFPGSTAIQASTALINALRADGETPLVLGTAEGPLGLFGARKFYRGKLSRVEPEDIMVSVLLNGVPTPLPTVHATGILKVGDDSGEAEFWWLDQPDNALALHWKFKDAEVQVIRIDTPVVDGSVAVSKLTEGLSGDACRAELNGVYFDTGSAALLPQSDGEIAKVATLMTEHPGWIFTIEGHTDNIGSEADNLSLSEHRASAVLSALKVAGVAPDRLTAVGLGEARPIASNDTLEGRARNRRVELARQCP
jgi:outer membrane protein OmpA-like peptidoglycan-associated protein